MNITIRELDEKAQLLRKIDTGKQDKLTYAVKKFNQNYTKSTREPREKLEGLAEDFRIEKASVDEKYNLIVSEKGQYSFDKENFALVTKKLKELNSTYLETEVDFESYLVDIDLVGLERAKILFDEFDIEQLTGIIFKPVTISEPNESKNE